MDAERLEDLLRALPPAPDSWLVQGQALIQDLAGGEDEWLAHGGAHDHAPDGLGDGSPDLGPSDLDDGSLHPDDPSHGHQHPGDDHHHDDGGDGW